MAKYRHVGAHPDEVSVGNKRVMLGPGEFIDLKAEDVDKNKALVEDGVLIAASAKGGGGESG
jgi:hypothetical protein